MKGETFSTGFTWFLLLYLLVSDHILPTYRFPVTQIEVAAMALLSALTFFVGRLTFQWRSVWWLLSQGVAVELTIWMLVKTHLVATVMVAHMYLILFVFAFDLIVNFRARRNAVPT